MDGLSKADVARAEGRDPAQAVKAIRPRDAATLILIERSGGDHRVLMGKRHARHAFQESSTTDSMTWAALIPM